MTLLEAISPPSPRARRRLPEPDAFLAETCAPQAQSNFRAPLALQRAPLPCSADEKWHYERSRVSD